MRREEETRLLLEALLPYSGWHQKE